MVRPNDPIPFIANFMLKNKHTMKKLEDFIKEQPRNKYEIEELEEDMHEMMDENYQQEPNEQAENNIKN